MIAVLIIEDPIYKTYHPSGQMEVEINSRKDIAFWMWKGKLIPDYETIANQLDGLKEK